MRKICEKCGKEFEPRQPHFRICPNCFKPTSNNQAIQSNLLLKSYYDQQGNLLKEVFIGIPEKLAILFSKDNLATKQLRDFFQVILKARNKALLQGINIAKPMIYECQRNATYQLKRGVIPVSFKKFLEHHLALAEVDEKSLDGFCQHMESIVAYFPKEKGG